MEGDMEGDSRADDARESALMLAREGVMSMKFEVIILMSFTKLKEKQIERQSK